MEAIIGTVENDVTETDLDILEGTKQRAGKTVDAFATRIYDQTSKILSAQEGGTNLLSIRNKAKRYSSGIPLPISTSCIYTVC